MRHHDLMLQAAEALASVPDSVKVISTRIDGDGVTLHVWAESFPPEMRRRGLSFSDMAQTVANGHHHFDVWDNSGPLPVRLTCCIKLPDGWASDAIRDAGIAALEKVER